MNTENCNDYPLFPDELMVGFEGVISMLEYNGIIKFNDDTGMIEGLVNMTFDEAIDRYIKKGETK